jgi:hypothetical protein
MTMVMVIGGGGGGRITTPMTISLEARLLGDLHCKLGGKERIKG